MNTNLLIEEIIKQRGLDGAKISDLLKSQLATLLQIKQLNPDRVLNEIIHLENPSKPSTTKEHSQLKGEILSGYWHKHYTTTAFVLKNINNQICTKKFQKQIEAKEASLDKEGKSPESICTELTDLHVRHAYSSRKTSSKLTGEWIIFKTHNNKNYYLTLATHTEDELSLKQRIIGHCTHQYPELF